MLKGKSVTLRPLKKADRTKTINWRNDLALTTLLMSHPFPITEEMEVEWFDHLLRDKSNRAIYFGIENSDKELVGMVFLDNINWIHRTCWFHIMIGDRKSQKTGMGSETMELIIDYVFNKLNFRKIMLEVTTSNKPAINLYIKSGFIKEGELKDQYCINGMLTDSYIMSLAKSK